MSDTIKTGANAPEQPTVPPMPECKPPKEHLTHEELVKALNLCDRLGGCRECPNLTPGTLGDLGGCDIGKCRFDLHEEIFHALDSQPPRLSEDVLSFLIQFISGYADTLDDLSDIFCEHPVPKEKALCSKALIQLETYRKAVEG